MAYNTTKHAFFHVMLLKNGMVLDNCQTFSTIALYHLGLLYKTTCYELYFDLQHKCLTQTIRCVNFLSACQQTSAYQQITNNERDPLVMIQSA